MDYKSAVNKTKAYSGYFNFPLTPSETHFWLISPHPVSKSLINKYLLELKPKESKLRKGLKINTDKKVRFAEKLIKYARFFPSIRLIALTGSVAANNSKTIDDLDLLIITSSNTLWLTRPFFLFFLSFKFNRRHPGDSPAGANNLFCPNLWLDSLSLSLPRNQRNIYTAHEVLQIKPIFDRGDTYRAFIHANSWTKHYLTNAYTQLSKSKHKEKNQKNLSFLLSPLNAIAFFLQYLFMLPKKTTERVSPHFAYFHKNDLSQRLEDLLK